jgi:hypothetical protein
MPGAGSGNVRKKYVFAMATGFPVLLQWMNSSPPNVSRAIHFAVSLTKSGFQTQYNPYERVDRLPCAAFPDAVLCLTIGWTSQSGAERRRASMSDLCTLPCMSGMDMHSCR